MNADNTGVLRSSGSSGVAGLPTFVSHTLSDQLSAISYQPWVTGRWFAF